MSVLNSNFIGVKEFEEKKWVGMNAITTLPTRLETSSDLAIKIKVVNAETGEFQERLIAFSSGKREYLLGRHPSCDLVLDSAEVSRIHGRIWCQDGQCFFADLGSTVGSQIDDREVEINQVHPLNQDNLLRIGGYVLTITTMPANACTKQISPAKPVAVTSRRTHHNSPRESNCSLYPSN